jgi:hypothetical protein
MGWGNACETFQQEIEDQLRSDDSISIDAKVIRDMREDMKFLATMTRRLLTVYREHRKR